MKKVFGVLCALMLVVACAPRGNTGLSKTHPNETKEKLKPNGIKRGEQGQKAKKDDFSNKPFLLDANLIVNYGDGLLKMTQYPLNLSIREGREVQTFFKFNSKTGQSFKLLMNETSNDCQNFEGEWSLMSEDKNKVLADKMNVKQAIEIKKDTNYLLTLKFKNNKCKKVDLKLVAWVGLKNEDPAMVRMCDVIVDNAWKSYSQILDSANSMSEIYYTFNKAFMDESVFCGEDFPSKVTTVQGDSPTSETFSVRSKENGEANLEMGFDATFDMSTGTGTYTCVANNLETQTASVIRQGSFKKCSDNILDKNIFKE